MKENIALIGFMGSGKTTIGKILAKELDMKFIDIDKLISSEEQKSIDSIFREKGEDYFRNKERESLVKISKKNNIVISTGGGTIVNIENIESLKKSSFIVFLDCTFKCIYSRVNRSKKRPLLREQYDTFEKLNQLYVNRLPFYKKSAEFSIYIDENKNIRHTVDEIKTAYIES